MDVNLQIHVISDVKMKLSEALNHYGAIAFFSVLHMDSFMPFGLHRVLSFSFFLFYT